MTREIIREVLYALMTRITGIILICYGSVDTLVFLLRIPIVFVAPETSPGSYTGALGGPPLISEWIEKERSKIIYKLNTALPDARFIYYTVTNAEEAKKIVDAEKESIGFVVVLLHVWSGGATRVFIESGKPVILIAESYGGGGEFLLEMRRAVEEKRRVVGISVRDLDNDIVIRKIKLLYTLHKLSSTRILFVTIDRERIEYFKKILGEHFGIEAIYIDGREFAEKYYRVADEEEARRIVLEWVSGAERVLEDRFEDLLKAAKLYLAMKRILQEYKAISIAIDCIYLFDKKILDAWPCLGYMKLWLEGFVPVCEADPYSAAILLVMWYLAERPGFISDPVLDQARDEVIYYHCYSPINPFGGNVKVPYIITPAHLGVKRASVHVKLPVNEVITVAQFVPEQRIMTIHRGKTIGNEYSLHACATKLVAKTNTRNLARNWLGGWHRVVFYGDFTDDLRDLATLIGYSVLEEDKE